MSKLYPPIIAGKLPAFVKVPETEWEGSKAYIKIPFKMNKTVSYDEVGGFALKIKTIGGFDVFGAVIKIFADSDYYSKSQMYDGIVEFALDSAQADLIYAGQFYKAQIAYIDTTGEISDYYSTVGVIKCVGEPEFGIRGLKNVEITESEKQTYYLNPYTVERCVIDFLDIDKQKVTQFRPETTLCYITIKMPKTFANTSIVVAGQINEDERWTGGEIDETDEIILILDQKQEYTYGTVRLKTPLVINSLIDSEILIQNFNQCKITLTQPFIDTKAMIASEICVVQAKDNVIVNNNICTHALVDCALLVSQFYCGDKIMIKKNQLLLQYQVKDSGISYPVFSAEDVVYAITDNTVQHLLIPIPIIANIPLKAENYRFTNFLNNKLVAYTNHKTETPYTDNEHQYFYIGEYAPSNIDITEKLYSSYFKVYKDSNIIAESGIIIHNNANNDDEVFSYLEELDPDSEYQIEYGIKTINGYEDSRIYTIKQNESLPELPEVDSEIKVNFDQSYISIQAKSNESNTVLLLRKGENNLWECINIQDMEGINCKDYSIEQGIDYTYAIQGYDADNKKITSKKQELESVYADFEDIFLWDGDRQLNIRFNPKVSSYRNNVFESKIDTLGGKYPLFTRNGDSDYVDLPISGLISYWMDNEDEFMDKAKLKLNKTKSARSSTNEIAGTGDDHYIKTRNLDGKNMYAERVFRQEVYAWLNNGKPKLFKSAAEGTHIVRLMNVSLSPVDTLGRMLYSFNCNAYEIADFTLENINALLPGTQRTNILGLRPISEMKVGG